MTSPLRRRSSQVTSLLFVFLLAGVGACSGSPSKGKLKGIAASDEVRVKRERAERELRARADEISRESSWGPALRVTVVDTCARGGDKNFFDPNPPKQPAMRCRMLLHLYFVVDSPVPQVLEDLRGMKTPTAWNDYWIRRALRYYEEKRYDKPGAIPPSIRSVPGGEDLSWDTPGDRAEAKISEPCPARKAIFSTCASNPDDVTLSALRKRPGTLFEWTLTEEYHTVWDA